MAARTKRFGPGIGPRAALVLISTPRTRGLLPGRDVATMLSPEDLAEQYWQLHRQPPSIWTQELDVRPATEKF